MNGESSGDFAIKALWGEVWIHDIGASMCQMLIYYTSVHSELKNSIVLDKQNKYCLKVNIESWLLSITGRMSYTEREREQERERCRRV